MVPRLPVVALSIGVLLAAVFPARAGDAPAAEVPLPPLTPKGVYRVLTQDDATSTSKCIGDPKTPLCAVETVLACLFRGRDDLCRVGMGLDRNPGYGNHDPTDRVLYRVVLSQVLSRTNYPWNPKRKEAQRPGVPAMRDGDVRIDLDWRECDNRSPRCDASLGTVAYIVRLSQGRWVVTTWGPARDPRDDSR